MQGPDAVMRRLDRLERENRLWRAGVLLALTVAIMGQAVPVSRVIEAEEFVLRDRQGRLRAQLAMARQV